MKRNEFDGGMHSRALLKMALIKWLKDLSLASERRVGSKAAVLGSVMNMGWDVPLGFVVTDEFYQRFLLINNIKSKVENLLAVISFDNEEHAQRIANEIQKLIINTPMPSGLLSEVGEYYEALSVRQEETSQTLLAPSRPVAVAVRTSVALPERFGAGTELPGTFGMFANVVGRERVAKAVQACWASRFTLKVLKMMHSFGEDVSGMPLSVIVQKIVIPEKAGVVSTFDERASEGEFVIDAYWGFRESSAEELQNADTYWVNVGERMVSRREVRQKSHEFVRDIESDNIVKRELSPRKSRAQVLDEREAVEIGVMANRIRKQLGSEQRITWAVSGKRIYVLKVVQEGVRPAAQLEETAGRREEAEQKGDDSMISEDNSLYDNSGSVPSGEGGGETGNPEESEMNVGKKSDMRESSDGESIVSSYREHIKESMEEEGSGKEYDAAGLLLGNAFNLAGHAVGDALRAVTVKLREIYAQKLGGPVPEYLPDIVEKLGIERAGDILRLYNNYLLFMREGRQISPKEVSECLRICSEIINSQSL